MRLRLLPLAAALVLAAPAAAADAATQVDAAPRIEARAWLVQNSATGEVLLSQNARERLPFASITKLMTVLVTLDHARLDESVTVTPRSAAVGGSSIHLRPGERISVRDLVAAALVQSANDAANALAVHVGRGSEDRFVGLMNAKARALGLSDTNFVRPDGLDSSGHVSSARDVTKLARVAMNKPIVREIVRLKSIAAGGRILHTWNDLLASFPGLIGVKTGHTTRAGWSQVAAARGRGLTVYATILGSPTRAQRNADLAELLVWGLSRYRVVSAIEPERTYARARTEFGRRNVRLVASKPMIKVVRVDRPLVERVVAPLVVSLPVTRGQRLGEVRVFSDGRLLGSRPLVAAESISRPGLVGRVRWYAGKTLENAWDVIG